MKSCTRALHGALLVAVLSGCSSGGVVQIAPDQFAVSKSSAAGAFANTSKLKADTINEANKFASARGLVAVPISMNESRPSVGFPSCEYVFTLMDEASYRKMRKSQARDWASLSPAQRIQHDLAMQQMAQQERTTAAAIQAQQSAVAAGAINSALDRAAYNQRTQTLSQPVNVNVRGNVTVREQQGFITPIYP